MNTDPAELRTRMRAGLTSAMKARDKVTVAALRTALAAFDNAEAVPVPPTPNEGSPTPSQGPPATSEHVAGTSVGLGSAETDRRALTVDDLHAVLRGQIDERTAEADTYADHGRADAADRLRREADALRAYLPG